MLCSLHVGLASFVGHTVHPQTLRLAHPWKKVVREIEIESNQGARKRKGGAVEQPQYRLDRGMNGIKSLIMRDSMPGINIVVFSPLVQVN